MDTLQNKENKIDLLSLYPDELKEFIVSLGEPAYRAKQLIAEGGIDSNRVIATLEKCLGTELVEH